MRNRSRTKALVVSEIRGLQHFLLFFYRRLSIIPRVLQGGLLAHAVLTAYAWEMARSLCVLENSSKMSGKGVIQP